jgi:hypothetical protein
MRRTPVLYRGRVTSVRVPAVQDSPVLLDQAATLDRVDELTDQAAGQGRSISKRLTTHALEIQQDRP